MSAKSKLRDSRVIRDVGTDKQKAERMYECNLRSLASAVGQGRLEVKGSRLV